MKRTVSLVIVILAVSACTTLDVQTKSSKRSAPASVAQAATEAASPSAQPRENPNPEKTKRYRYALTDDAGAQVETRPARRAAAAVEEQQAALAASEVVVNDSNVFKGAARANAKTSLAHAKIEKFSDLESLVAAIPTDEFMQNYDPKIMRDTPRVREESRNVGVCAWIVATKREDDNDYHVMISSADATIFNAEISGLPDSGNKSTLKKLATVRNTFEGFVEEAGRRTGTYTAWGDPVPVYMEGSLFYDTEHKPGKVGPAFARPKTSWEIHPVSKLIMEPDEDTCPGMQN